MKKTAILLTAFVAFAALSCKKKEKSGSTAFEGSIDITSIHPHDTIHGGNSFTVLGTATANTEMHGYDLQLLDSAGNFLQDFPASDHSTSYTFNHTFSHSFTDTMDLQLNVLIVEDHDGNMLTKNIPFVFIP